MSALTILAEVATTKIYSYDEIYNIYTKESEKRKSKLTIAAKLNIPPIDVWYDSHKLHDACNSNVIDLLTKSLVSDVVIVLAFVHDGILPKDVTASTYNLAVNLDLAIEFQLYIKTQGKLNPMEFRYNGEPFLDYSQKNNIYNTLPGNESILETQPILDGYIVQNYAVKAVRAMLSMCEPGIKWKDCKAIIADFNDYRHGTTMKSSLEISKALYKKCLADNFPTKIADELLAAAPIKPSDNITQMVDVEKRCYVHGAIVGLLIDKTNVYEYREYKNCQDAQQDCEIIKRKLRGI